MRKLIIHPKDKTTDFLKGIYHGRNDVTVITGGCTKDDVKDAIAKHDHIIMMGHGTPQGLLAMNQFNGKPKKPVVTPKPSTAIRASGKPVTNDDIKDFYRSNKTEDDWFADRKVGSGYNYSGGGSYYTSLTTGYIIDDSMADLLRGKKLTAIWCNADQYMEWNELDGFYTGMFISDESEAKMIGCAETDQWLVDQQNYAFVEVVRRFLDQDGGVLHEALMNQYGPLAERNPVAKYNVKRMYNHRNSEFSRKAIAS